VAAETAHAHHAAAVHAYENSDTALEDEMHRIGRLALAGDVLAGLDLDPCATLGQAVSVLRAAERVRQPTAQR
jgi:hypothetical protein